jgi:hypothetical protein
VEEKGPFRWAGQRNGFLIGDKMADEIDVLDSSSGYGGIADEAFGGSLIYAQSQGTVVGGNESQNSGGGIWGILTDLTTGFGQLAGTGFDVYADYKADQKALKTPENALSQQTLILLGVGAIALIILLTRK